MGLGSALIRSATLFRQATTGENDGKHVKACSLKCVVGIDVRRLARLVDCFAVV